MILFPLTAGLLVAVYTMRQPPRYTSTATFRPQGAETGAVEGLAGLASQFGVNLGSAAGVSIAFYADLLQNREILKQAVVSEYRTAEAEDGPRSGDLVEILGIEAEVRPRAVAQASSWLRDHMGIRTEADTGTITVAISTRWPSLSLQLADRMIELLNRYNLEVRQSQAKMEREFIEDQLAEAEAALLAAEDTLGRFLERNRRYENSPELRFQFDRLQRRVFLRQSVFTSLAQSLEQVRMREVRNTPVITVLEPPELPLRASSTELLRKTGLGVAVGLVLAAIWAFGRERLSSTPEREPDDYAEFKRIKEDALDDVRTAAGWFSGLGEKGRRSMSGRGTS